MAYEARVWEKHLGKNSRGKVLTGTYKLEEEGGGARAPKDAKIGGRGGGEPLKHASMSFPKLGVGERRILKEQNAFIADRANTIKCKVHFKKNLP